MKKYFCVFPLKTLMLATVYFGFCGIVFSSAIRAQSPEQGEVIYQQRCGICHDRAEDFTPPKSTFSFRSANFVIAALTTGAMQAQAEGLSVEQRQSVAMYVTGKSLTSTVENDKDNWEINYCAAPAKKITGNDFHWNGWGGNVKGSRFQENTSIVVEDIAKLKVKWAFAYPSGRVNSQPIVIGDRVLVASRPGLIYSLDAKSGCTHWAVEVDGGARASMSVAVIPNSNPPEYAVYLGSNARNVVALNLDTGKTIWQTNIDQHSRSGITGSPIVAGDKLIVPLSSLEEVAARDENYECCTFIGALVALDRFSGEILWKTHTIDEASKPFKKNSAGVQMYGPAGAAVWSAPSFDRQRQLIYAATGDSYTDVVENGSDAVVAFDVNTGKIVWRNQVTEKDSYVLGCIGASHANCPENLGPDFDFGSTPIIHNYVDQQGNHKTLLLAGQKSGIMYAMDPDNKGEIVWQQRPGVGSVRGGIQWGSAADENTVYAAVSDSIAPSEDRRPGVSAYDILSGKELWHTPALEGECVDLSGRVTCTNGHSSAITAIPGVVFSGALNGIFQAYSSVDGQELLMIDMNKLVLESVNGITVRGGKMDGGGPVVAGDTLFVNVGYGGIPGQPGNVLLAISVDGE